jgi:hypothetical protein
MIDLSNYKSRREIEIILAADKRYNWSEIERKAGIKFAKRHQYRNRLRVLYRNQDVPKLIAAAKEDRRRVYPTAEARP